MFGLFSDLTWWITDKLQANGMYGYLKYNYSEYARVNNRDITNMAQTYAVNLLYDANQAIRFGLQWMTQFNGYNGVNAGTGTGGGFAERTGTIDTYRLGVWYFF